MIQKYFRCFAVKLWPSCCCHHALFVCLFFYWGKGVCCQKNFSQVKTRHTNVCGFKYSDKSNLQEGTLISTHILNAFFFFQLSASKSKVQMQQFVSSKEFFGTGKSRVSRGGHSLTADSYFKAPLFDSPPMKAQKINSPGY